MEHLILIVRGSGEIGTRADGPIREKKSKVVGCRDKRSCQRKGGMARKVNPEEKGGVFGGKAVKGNAFFRTRMESGSRS